MTNREEIINKALSIILPLRRAGIGMSMGIGKTFIGLKHMEDRYNKGKRKFLVAAPKLSIIETWKSEAVKFHMEYLKGHVNFTTYLSLSKQSTDYDVVYLDECHSLTYGHELWLGMFGGEILGLTGTPPKRDDTEKGKMVSMFCPIVYTYVVDQAVDSKILNNYKIIVHALPLGQQNTYMIKTKTRNFMTSEQKSYKYWTDMVEAAGSKKEEMFQRIKRMMYMKAFPSKLKYALTLAGETTDKVLIFCNTQQQADEACKFSVHSKNPDSKANLKMFESGAIRRLSCVQQLNEGVNIPNLKECIVLHSYANERNFSQRFGRMLRLNPDDTATIHILMYTGTVDEQWVMKALEEFDSSKISYNV